MESTLLQVYQRQVVFQAECTLNAATVINAGLQANNAAVVFAGIQNLFFAAAQVSRLLWGAPGKDDVAASRQALRDSAGITDESPLYALRTRDHGFENIDDRLDEWSQKSATHTFVDMRVAVASSFEHTDPVELFRAFDPRTMDLFLWGERFNVEAVLGEVRRLMPKVREQVVKAEA